MFLQNLKKIIQPQSAPLTPAAFVMVAAAVVSGCNSEASSGAKQAGTSPQPVEAVAVAMQDMAHSWSYVGTLQPRYETGLAFRVGGKVLERLVDAGQTVSARQIIARLDPADYELSVAAQEAELAAATTSRREADAALDRYQILMAQGHVSKAALDQKASAAAEAAGRVERATKSLDLARNQLAYTSLTADQPGIMTSVSFERGQVVASGQIVAKAARLDAVEAEVAIPENQIEDVRSARAQIELWQSGGQRLPAVLREVSPQADSVSRTYRARFSIPGLHDPAFGRTATVYLSSGPQGQVAALPLSAVMNDGSGAKVWVLSADKSRAVPVSVDVRTVEKDRVLVTAPFKPGDLVVALGVHMLDPEKPVRLVQQRQAMNVR